MRQRLEEELEAKIQARGLNMSGGLKHEAKTLNRL